MYVDLPYIMEKSYTITRTLSTEIIYKNRYRYLVVGKDQVWCYFFDAGSWSF